MGLVDGEPGGGMSFPQYGKHMRKVSTLWKNSTRFAALLAEPHALAAEARRYRPRVRPAPGRVGLGIRLFFHTT